MTSATPISILCILCVGKLVKSLHEARYQRSSTVGILAYRKKCCRGFALRSIYLFLYSLILAVCWQSDPCYLLPAFPTTLLRGYLHTYGHMYLLSTSAHRGRKWFNSVASCLASHYNGSLEMFSYIIWANTTAKIKPNKGKNYLINIRRKVNNMNYFPLWSQNVFYQLVTCLSVLSYIHTCMYVWIRREVRFDNFVGFNKDNFHK